jgi:hypothetical protein
MRAIWERDDARRKDGELVQEALFTLLFAVIAVVSATTLAKTLTKPFEMGSLNPAQWVLFAVTTVGATLAFVRSIRFYASLSLVARLRRTRAEGSKDAAGGSTPQPPLHPVVDHVTWAALTLAIAVINVLALWAVILTLADLFGDAQTPTGWLLWQLAVLVAALAGLVRLTRSVIAELRDRSRRRRRNAVHVVANKLIYWPSQPQRASSAKRRTGQASGVVAGAVLAAASWASASGPLLEPVPEPGATPAGEAAPTTTSRPDGTSSSSRPAKVQPPGRRRSPAGVRAEKSHKNSGSTPRSQRSGSGRSTPVAPTATTQLPAPPSSPPASTAPATSDAPSAAPQTERRRSPRRPPERRRGRRDRPRGAPAPTPTPAPTTTPTPTPTPTPPPAAPTPGPAPEPPCEQPPCGVGQSTPQPG